MSDLPISRPRPRPGPLRIALPAVLSLSLALALALALGGAAPAARADAHQGAEAPQEPAAPEALPAAGAVARAQFTTEVEEREPVDALTHLANDAGEVFFFTDLRELDGQQVVHRWSHRGQVVAEVSFEVGGPRWRVWSRKTIPPEALGPWSVVVVDEAGRELARRDLEVAEAEPGPPAAPAPESPAPATPPPGSPVLLE